LIEVKNLTKKFKGNTVLQNINLRVDEGEIFGYLGPNGAGKTTTVRLILGLLKPTSGEALVWDKPLGEHPELRQQVGVVLETDGLYERLSARANLMYFARLYKVADHENKIRRLLAYVGLADRQNDKVGTFSKGMRRKLSLARSIVADPKVLFLDEPAAGLDPEAQRLVRELILQLARERGLAIFLNSHDLDEVERICTRVAILHKGEIKTYDRVANLRRSTEPVMELTLPDAVEVAKAVSFLNSQGFVKALQTQATHLKVTLNDEQMASRLLNVMVGQGINVEEARRLTRSLEDVYVEVMKEAR
jgi:ABC-2 type transport system ATP-binding protein